jgi:uncharacterized protein (DUF983 family)
VKATAPSANIGFAMLGAAVFGSVAIISLWMGLFAKCPKCGDRFAGQYLATKCRNCGATIEELADRVMK